MKVENRLLALVLALSLSLGVLGCLLRVYELPVEKTAVAAAILGSLLLGTLVLPLKKGRELTLCVVALVLGYLIRLPQTLGQGKSLLYLVSRTLDGQYHWGYFLFPGALPEFVTIPVGLLGGSLCLAVCRSVLRRASAVLPLLLTAPVLCLCTLLPGVNPPIWAVFLLLFAGGMLLLTSGARKKGALQGLRLSLRACVPVLVCGGLLLLLNPQGSYTDRAELLRERLRQVQGLTPNIPVTRHEGQVDLAALSGNEAPKRSVMTVTADTGGPLYLRGQDFDTYTGLGWTADPTRQELFDGWGREKGTVTVKTLGIEDVLYLPYYPGSGNVLVGGMRENTQGQRHYYIPCYSGGSAAASEELARYLQLPASTKAWAEAILPQKATPAAIRDMVRGSARYDLNTPQMPEGTEDFVRWFWEDSDRGYCVHFASLTTVLLRAAGIPARYVTGFLKEVTPGKAATVTTREAHAWTEYYDGEAGAWKILDATPSASNLPVVRETQTVQGATSKQEQISREKGNLNLRWLLIPIFAAVLPVRRALVLVWRRQRKCRSGTGKRMLLLWQEAEGLSKALGTVPPEELRQAAERAKFSNHRVIPMDLAPMERYCAACQEKLRRSPRWKRLWEKYGMVRI